MSRIKDYLQNPLAKIQALLMLVSGGLAMIWTGDFQKALLITVVSFFPAGIITLLYSHFNFKYLSPRRHRNVMTELRENGLSEMGFQQTGEAFYEGIIDRFHLCVSVFPKYPSEYLFYFETLIEAGNVTDEIQLELTQYYEIENLQDRWYSIKVTLANRRRTPGEPEIRLILHDMVSTLNRLGLQPAK